MKTIVITAVMGGRAGIREFFGRMIPRGRRWASDLLLALSPLALGVLAFTALRPLGEPHPSSAAFTQFAGFPQGLPAAVVTTMIMFWGVGVALQWWRRPSEQSPPGKLQR